MIRAVVEKYYSARLNKFNNVLSSATKNAEIVKNVDEFMRALEVKSNSMAQSYSPSIKLVQEFCGVTVNRDFGKNANTFVTSLIRNVEGKVHPIGCDTIRSVLDHEIGHQLDRMLGIGNIEEIQKLYNSRTTKQLTDDLSIYAWKNNNTNKYSEMIAEAWAEYCNNPKPREIANVVGKIIEIEYKKKYGLK